MPLGQRSGDKSDSRYCGVETDFDDDMPQALAFNLSGGFDFVVAPLVDPNYRPSLARDEADGSSVLPVVASDLVLCPSQWSSHVVGKNSTWIDLDSEDENVRMNSEIALKQEIAWASHLSLQACLFPSPRGPSCGNYARCVNQILQGLNNMQLWLRIPLKKSKLMDDDSGGGHTVDTWEWWNSFRLLCEHPRFAGYFDATLYKDVHLGIEPATATPNMFSWFAIFFPLRTPICVPPGSPLEVHFWKCCSSTKAQYRETRGNQFTSHPILMFVLEDPPLKMDL